VTKLWQVIKEVRMAATRFALLSCLAGYSKTDWPKSQFEEAQRVLSEWYAQESDSGIRAVAELILRRWGIEPSRTIQLEELETAKRRWFVNRQLQTYIIIDAEGFPMGSAIDESERDVDEVQHWRNISRRFAIAATEVTRRDFLRYRPDFPFRGRGIADSQSRPVGGVDWYSAAAYCNWLSDQEGIPREQWCYEPNDDGEYAAGMRIVPDSLQRTGYRLPTEAEWEFACRSGSRTSRYYGDDVALLDRYAWYSLNANDRSHAVGMLLPNGFGLFDTLGNVYEWCHDVSSSYPVAEGEQLATGADPIESEVATHDAQRRNLRGGSYDYSARHSRAAYRTNDNLDFVVGNDGFRPARTLPRNSSLNGR
jgi:formylglycine-generating enzyme required for sulfatase activity